MAIQNLAPDAVLESTNYTTLNNADIDDDPDLPGSDYGTWDTNGNTVCRVSFPTPSITPATGAGLQKFRVHMRRNGATTSAGWSLQLYESGVIVGSALATGTLTNTSPVTVEGTWNASSLGTASGANVECRLEQTSGGTGGTRSGIEVGAVKWAVTYTPTDIPDYGGVTIVSSRTRRPYLRPPQGPWVLNRGSTQACCLVAFYPLNGLLKDRNLVSGRYHLTGVNGGATITAGGPDGGQCHHCTGSDPPTAYSTSGDVPITTWPVTLAGWFNPEAASDPSGGTILANTSDNSSQLGWQIKQNGANVTANVEGSGYVGVSADTVKTIATAGVWYHGAGVFAANNSTAAFLNGGGKGTNGSTANAPSGLDKVIVGALRSTIDAYSFDGKLAHCCIWNRALSDAEVWALYDPATRWDLYYPLGRKVWSFAVGGGGGFQAAWARGCNVIITPGVV